jgi:hypothetical protein
MVSKLTARGTWEFSDLLNALASKFKVRERASVG